MDSFSKTIVVEPVYYAESELHEPFWSFMYRLQSLQRHWELSRILFNEHVAELLDTPDDGSAEFYDIFSETAQVDVECFLEYQRLSTISFGLSLVESLLVSLAEEISETFGKKIELDRRRLPYINKYILWLTRGCGLEVEVDKKLWKEVDAIRDLRNRFVHKIDREISDNTKQVMRDVMSDSLSNYEEVSDQFVDKSLSTLAELVKRIELAYICYYKEKQ